MKATIDRMDCIGCTLCVENCPSVFRMAYDGFAIVFGEINEDNTNDALEAAENCPVSVITISEE